MYFIMFSLYCHYLNYRSSSLSDLATHTDSIEMEIKTVLEVSRRVAKECTRHAISKRIEISLSKMETLSHQLCQVTKVKLKHCQGEGGVILSLITLLMYIPTDQSEKMAALTDLVASGVILLNTVDCLLKDIQTLGDVDINSKLLSCLIYNLHGRGLSYIIVCLECVSCLHKLFITNFVMMQSMTIQALTSYHWLRWWRSQRRCAPTGIVWQWNWRSAMELGRWEWSLITSECLTDNNHSPQAIERDHSTVETRFHAMMQFWMKRISPPPSCSALVRALQSAVIDHGAIARRVETISVRIALCDIKRVVHNDKLSTIRADTRIESILLCRVHFYPRIACNVNPTLMVHAHSQCYMCW